MHLIDLRSDTVSPPTAAMRRAMADAEVGDDYYGDDPTVHALEDKAAEMLGKPAAMLVLSGTMGNLVCLLAHARRGEAALMTGHSHILQNEAGHIAAVVGVVPLTVSASGPAPDPEQIVDVAQRKGIVAAPLRVLCLENTHNAAGGRCIGVEETSNLARTAHAHGLRVHIDGARLFNAAVALGVAATKLVDEADSVTFCLTKGLSCPVGSLVAGDADFIAQARRWRQMIGGGMRQAGCFAAAGLVALDCMIERLAEDHDNARRLGARLADLGFRLDPEEVETNIVFTEPPPGADAALLVEAMNTASVRVNPPKGQRIRLVTHAGVARRDIDMVTERIGRIVKAKRRELRSVRRSILDRN